MNVIMMMIVIEFLIPPVVNLTTWDRQNGRLSIFVSPFPATWESLTSFPGPFFGQPVYSQNCSTGDGNTDDIADFSNGLNAVGFCETVKR
ncbi:hypothetical protein AVEN_228417-1 [Araneus ventricosus]|uniref:Uncharacterized protein n=1 Tax=Araneus ventricosus TaxID=182803 RepID=A0A4Y2S536_ARAVE|nr:hypothetical protein AVEN_228417-1 [Araneus ventricosus]